MRVLKAWRSNQLTAKFTGVEADARTVVELSDFSSTGLVSFNLSGADLNSVAINAIIAETDDLQFLEKLH